MLKLSLTNGAKCVKVIVAPPNWLEVTAVIICVAIVVAVINLCGLSIVLQNQLCNLKILLCS